MGEIERVVAEHEGVPDAGQGTQSRSLTLWKTWGYPKVAPPDCPFLPYTLG